MGESLIKVIEQCATLGEGPCWDAREQLLYWVDIMEKKVHIFDPVHQTNRTIETGQYVGAVVPREKGGAVVAMQNGFYFLDTQSGALTPIHDPEADKHDNRFNDGKCDAAGRFFAGTMSLEEQDPVGALYRLDTDLSVNKMLDRITVSNGIAWSPDHRTMYYNDSPTRVIAAFDYDLETGRMSRKRIVVQIPEGEGVPDGMTIDQEGMLWVAQWGGYQVARWNPHTGEKLQSIPVPVMETSSCTFGGPNLNELYITTARVGLDAQALAHQPHAGCLFRIKVDVQGFPADVFRG